MASYRSSESLYIYNIGYDGKFSTENKIKLAKSSSQFIAQTKPLQNQFYTVKFSCFMLNYNLGNTSLYVS